MIPPSSSLSTSRSVANASNSFVPRDPSYRSWLRLLPGSADPVVRVPMPLTPRREDHVPAINPRVQPNPRPRPPRILVPPPSPKCQKVEAFNSALPLILPGNEHTSPVPILQGPQATVRPVAPQEQTANRVAETSRTYTNILDLRVGPQETRSSYKTASGDRKLLIIGVDNEFVFPNASRSFRLSQLGGVENDSNNLKSAFELRGYSVQTMIQGNFGREEIIQRVKSFLSSAVLGDVRAIVFTGHAIPVGEMGQVAFVPQRCQAPEDAITSELWNKTLRDHAKAGVVVLSIFATCMSGAILQDCVTLPDFSRLSERQIAGSPKAPVVVSFSSSGASELSHELLAPPLSVSTPTAWHSSDPFLWALAAVVTRRDLRDWDGFIRALQHTFTYVREGAALQYFALSPRESDPPEIWLARNPQAPCIALSHRYMPRFSLVLPSPVD